MNRTPVPHRPPRQQTSRPLTALHLTLLGLVLTLCAAHPTTGPRPTRSTRPTQWFNGSSQRLNGSPQRLKGSGGDVPGWVMVTLMSALLVAGIYAVAGPALINMFTNAIDKVGGLR